MTWTAWIPLGVVVTLLVVAETAFVVTDRTFWARRELQTLGRGVFDAIGAMEERGIRVRQHIVATEGRGSVRSLVRRNSWAFWGFVVVLSLAAVVTAWPWWIPALIVGLVLAGQTVDARAALGLRRVEGTASRSRAVARNITHALAALVIVAGVLAVGWGLAPHAPTGELGRRVAGAVVGIALLYLAIALRRRAERFGSVVDLEPRFGEDASRDDVLFLRSFKDDELSIRAVDPVLGRLGLLVGYRTRFEEYVANLVQRQQRLIAIGKPGEPLPELGAVRTYFADDEWQGAIDATTRRVGAIVMVAAGTGGFEWELTLLRRTENLWKTVILIPPIGTDASVERMQDLMARLDIHVLDGLSSEDFDRWGAVLLLTLTAIGFTREGSPVLYLSMGRDWAGYAGTMVRAFGILSGRLDPPKHGEIARQVGLEVPVVEQ